MTQVRFKELSGDLWDGHDVGAVVVITTSGAVSKKGAGLLLRGCARQARDRFPELSTTLGALICQHGSQVFDLGHRIVSFPVEADPFQVPDLRLIEKSCRELVLLTNDRGWQKIVVPRPGCGGGGLAWADVRPILARHFDERFIVIHQEGDL